MKAFAQVISLVVISVVVIIIPPCGAALGGTSVSISSE
ncbi:ilv operon leader peptide [Enterobacter hormaechei]|nr:ilv operon leader peptide [Enterobacter hormaechei]PCO16527.1 ilv operon leader peptide [Enterobacter hormaechei]